MRTITLYRAAADGEGVSGDEEEAEWNPVLVLHAARTPMFKVGEIFDLGGHTVKVEPCTRT